ncbi:MAG: YfaZ family outer membrane protein [Pseudomonadota bacterium]
MKKHILPCILLLCATHAQADGLDISLSSETASIVYLSDSSSLGYGGADVGYGVFFNEEDDYLFNANFLVSGKPASQQQPLQFGVGAKGYLGIFDESDFDIGALGIGGQIRYVIPSSVAPMAAALEIYYAPDITSFGDATSLTEVALRYEFEIVPSTRAYVGYRLIEVDFDDVDDVEIDDEFHLGIRFNIN